MKEVKKQRLLALIEEVKKKDPDTIKIVLPGFIGKKSVSYLFILEDLIFIQDATRRLLVEKKSSENDHLLIASLWKSIIATYGKCFTENKGGFSKLTNDLINSEEFKKTHERLMDLRHGFIAHRDDSEKEIAFIYMRLPAEDAIGNQTEFRIHSSKEISPNEEEANHYLELFNHLIQKVREKIQKNAQKAHDDLLKVFTPEELAMMRF